MKDSIEIYTSIRKWKDLRLKFVENMKKKQASCGKESILSDESEKKLRDEMNDLELAFFNESTDVEFIVTHTFPELKKGAWFNNYYIEENRIDFGGYEYKLYEEACDLEHLKKCYTALEDAVSDVKKYINSPCTVDEIIDKFFF